MTSVVGILNKRGIALAADSAVTREYGSNKHKVTKCTKNGNKMVRLSNIVPITVMFTGDASFLATPWDVIARRYRQKRGDIAHATVEDAVKDFFDFISANPVLWDHEETNNFMTTFIDEQFNKILNGMDDELQLDDTGEMLHPEHFVKSFISKCNMNRLLPKIIGECPQFIGYSLDVFREKVEFMMDIYFNNDLFGYPENVLREIRPYFEGNVLSILSAISDKGKHVAELIFSGFGADQQYPSLIPVLVNGGFDFRVRYNYNEEDVVNISDRRPVAICPFAQADVIKSILRGKHAGWSKQVLDSLNEIINPCSNVIFDTFFDPSAPEGLREKLGEIEVADLYDKSDDEDLKHSDKTQKEWEKSLKDYDLEEMAALADSLIDLTGFQRILTFSPEGVGGPVDLAVISKTDGFTWIRRKNWYHKDNGLSI